MAKLTIYKSDSCEACKQMVPIIKKNAKIRGDKVKVVDIDKCSSKECEAIEYTPTVLKDGKPVSGAELKRLLK